MRFVLGLCLLLLATGCSTYSLQELKTATPKGTPFQAALAVRYMKFSEEKAAKYNWVDSGYFADKGLKAAYGHEVLPENPERWNIPAAKRAELEAEHKALVGALEGGAAAAHPDNAAAAQVFFDCWVENQDANWQADQIAYCRDNFEQAMRSLRSGKTDEPVEIPKKMPDLAGKTAYIVFFGMNRDGLDDSGSRVVDGVVADIKKQGGGYTVVLNGHADTVGDRRYNFDLSRRRAQSVLDALAERGIPAAQIRPYGFGDTDPAVQTGPGVPEPHNRRVEIYIGDE